MLKCLVKKKRLSCYICQVIVLDQPIQTTVSSIKNSRVEPQSSGGSDPCLLPYCVHAHPRCLPSLNHVIICLSSIEILWRCVSYSRGKFGVYFPKEINQIYFHFCNIPHINMCNA